MIWKALAIAAIWFAPWISLIIATIINRQGFNLDLTPWVFASQAFATLAVMYYG